jgi:hypothetical protein
MAGVEKKVQVTGKKNKNKPAGGGDDDLGG